MEAKTDLLRELHDVNLTASGKFNGFVINGAAFMSELDYKYYHNRKWIARTNAAAEALWAAKEMIEDGC